MMIVYKSYNTFVERRVNFSGNLYRIQECTLLYMGEAEKVCAENGDRTKEKDKTEGGQVWQMSKRQGSPKNKQSIPQPC